MPYQNPNDQHKGLAESQRGGANLPRRDPEVARLKNEVAEQYRRGAQDEKIIEGLREKLQELSDRWEKDRVELTAFAQGLQVRALDAERKNTLLEHAELPRLRQRFEKLEGTEEALQKVAEGIACILEVLGRAAPQKTFTGKTPIEVADFILDKVEVVSEAIKGLRERVEKGRNRLSLLTEENAKLNQQLKPLEKEVIKLENKANQLVNKLEAAQVRNRELVEIIAASRNDEPVWLADPIKKDIAQICTELEVVGSLEKTDYDKILRFINLDPDSYKKLSAILTKLTQAGELLEQNEANLESPEYERICKAKISCEKIIIDYLNQYQNVDLLLRMNPELTAGVVNRLGDRLAERLMAAYLIDPAQDHILSSQQLFSLVEKLPAASHAAMALNSSDSETQLTLLLGSASVRAGVSMLAKRLPRSELKDLDVKESLAKLQKIISTAADVAEVSAYEKAAEVLRVLEHVPEPILSGLINKYATDKESCSKSVTVLGFDLRYALSLARKG